MPEDEVGQGYEALEARHLGESEQQLGSAQLGEEHSVLVYPREAEGEAECGVQRVGVHGNPYQGHDRPEPWKTTHR